MAPRAAPLARRSASASSASVQDSSNSSNSSTAPTTAPTNGVHKTTNKFSEARLKAMKAKKADQVSQALATSDESTSTVNGNNGIKKPAKVENPKGRGSRANSRLAEKTAQPANVKKAAKKADIAAAAAKKVTFAENTKAAAPSKATSKATKAGKATSKAASKVTKSAPKTAKGTKAAKVDVPARNDMYHAKGEHASMVVFADYIHKAGLIDEETKDQMSEYWQGKGELTMKWPEKYHLGEEDGVIKQEIMSLEEAEAIAEKKDEERLKFLEQYAAGEIDEDGNTIMSDAEADDEPAATGDAALRAALKETATRLIKKPVSVKARRARPAAHPVVPSASGSHDSPILLAVSADDEPSAEGPVRAAPVKPLPGMSDYEQYDYYQLAALCHERNVVSGQGVAVIRQRLIQDDINVVQGLPRDAKPYAKEKKRARKTVAPKVPNAPAAPPAVHPDVLAKQQKQAQAAAAKRKRDDGGEDGGKGKKARK
ncbi:hypothetical protein P280DRAFT_514880 [Massarina eburnea CBS 473.64]|uniref:Uncharacterized protein n=1 Tax=Massarina eburnea CBS 473.64 TaxID=1395130 RepID=A0A6A6S823_9PLEO|nr:hypothetical protein P280DRAFT_514880 [Massarina eburnea CBS 473.64]